MNLGERIRHARQAREITQCALAKRVGISNNAMHKIEVGETPAPRLPHVATIARVLQVSLDYLAGLTDDPHPHSRPEAVFAANIFPPRRMMDRLMADSV